jgi:hypothetical protein
MGRAVQPSVQAVAAHSSVRVAQAKGQWCYATGRAEAPARAADSVKMQSGICSTAGVQLPLATRTRRPNGFHPASTRPFLVAFRPLRTTVL